jgi:septum formation protein
VEFEVRPAEVVELVDGDPSEVARENARRKALAVDGPVVLGADTLVVLEGRTLPKPRDEEQARSWLTALSGRSHRVVGGICVRTGELDTAVVATDVRFRALDEAAIAWYLASGEWRDRAGGYAIQGRGAALVAAIDGDYLNVVGLPVATLLDLVPDLVAA